MRVCFLTHYFPPEVGAPQTRIELLARTLASSGLEVTVHTGFPHYPDGVVKAPYRNRPWLLERRDGIAIVRSGIYPGANRGFAERLLDHAALALSAIATARLTGPLDVVVAETPPLFTAASGVAYAAIKRAACVLNVADRWPASAVELGALRSGTAIALAEALERFVYRHADLITSPTEGIAETLAGVPEAADKSRRLWPVVDIDRFDARPRDPRAADAPLRVLYAGTIGMAHGLEVLLEASRLAGPDVVQTKIAGDGADTERLRRLIAAGRLGNVELLGARPAGQIPELYAHCDASAVLLRDLPIFRGALPTKMLEAMAAGRALVLCAQGEAQRLLEAAQAGIVAAPGDPAALADAFRRLQADPGLRVGLGQAGRAYAERHFGAQRAAEAWSAVLRDAVSARAGRAAPP